MVDTSKVVVTNREGNNKVANALLVLRGRYDTPDTDGGAAFPALLPRDARNVALPVYNSSIC